MKPFQVMAAAARKTVEYKTESLILDFTEQVVGRMRELKINKTELAFKIGTSPAYVTNVLKGSNNFSIETMAKIAFALRSEIKITLHDHHH